MPHEDGLSRPAAWGKMAFFFLHGGLSGVLRCFFTFLYSTEHGLLSRLLWAILARYCCSCSTRWPLWPTSGGKTSWVGPKSGGTSLPCPSFPTLNTVLNQSSSIARDGRGWCCAGFIKNSVAAPQGPPQQVLPLGTRALFCAHAWVSKGIIPHGDEVPVRAHHQCQH